MFAALLQLETIKIVNILNWGAGLPRAWPEANVLLGALYQIFFWKKLFSDNNNLPPPFFREKILPDEYVVIAFQRLYLNFSYQISVLC